MDILFDQQNFDLVFTDGDLAITDNSEGKLIQRLFVRLKTYSRDLFWNPTYGIDFLNDVLGKNKQQRIVDKIMKDEIKKEELVEEITFFDSQIEGYAYACQFSVKLKYEPTISNFFILSTPTGLTLTDENGNPFAVRLI